jgi:hypothetical protein
LGLAVPVGLVSGLGFFDEGGASGGDILTKMTAEIF